jgi:hypothetical protein
LVPFVKEDLEEEVGEVVIQLRQGVLEEEEVHPVVAVVVEEPPWIQLLRTLVLADKAAQE